jgi:hypothetical protein
MAWYRRTERYDTTVLISNMTPASSRFILYLSVPQVGVGTCSYSRLRTRGRHESTYNHKAREDDESNRASASSSSSVRTYVFARPLLFYMPPWASNKLKDGTKTIQIHIGSGAFWLVGHDHDTQSPCRVHPKIKKHTHIHTSTS